jgi:hypothetical protein
MLLGENDIVINLGFEDSTVNTVEEVNSDPHDAIQMSSQMVDDKNKNRTNESNETSDLLIRIKALQSLKEEIEQFDVYQSRYNTSSESQEFFKSITAYNLETRNEQKEEPQKLVIFKLSLLVNFDE